MQCSVLILYFVKQLEFPQAMGLSGELFSRQTKLEHFDCGVSVKVIINKNVSSQVSPLVITVLLLKLEAFAVLTPNDYSGEV